eukprot:c25677_g3_i1 orf=528-2423(+)
MHSPEMGHLLEEEIKQYSHSPVHYAISRRDHATLRSILESLPSLAKAGEVATESQSIIEEQKADRVSAEIDRRDVSGRETPLHLAVRLGDADAVEMLMAAGADWSLQNEQGWSALQEAVCTKKEAIAILISRYYQPMAWAKWCRRLPRITATMRRMRDFYMEITFNFESSVVPFIGRIAPSDTYKIWKRGSCLRADMTLAGFDGFKVQRSNQSVLFLGDGQENGKLLVLTHKDKEITNALEAVEVHQSEAEIARDIAVMSKTNIYRPGIDVTQAELVPQLNWRRQEKTELVGLWKAKVYDMHHVMVSIRSRRVPGTATDEDLLVTEIERQERKLEDDCINQLTEEEKDQLRIALSMDNPGVIEEGFDHCQMHGIRNGYNQSGDLGDNEDENASVTLSLPKENGAVGSLGPSEDGKKGRFSWGRKVTKYEGSNGATGKTPNKAVGQAPESSHIFVGKWSSNVKNKGGERNAKGKGKFAERQDDSTDSTPKHRIMSTYNGNLESEYKKGLQPVLWLTPNFPLKTEELLPLLDILANKVKAIRRLKEVLTTKLPLGTFPVKVSQCRFKKMLLKNKSPNPNRRRNGKENKLKKMRAGFHICLIVIETVASILGDLCYYLLLLIRLPLDLVVKYPF